MGVLGPASLSFGYGAEQEVKRGLSASVAAEQVGVVVVESFMVIRKVTVSSARGQ
jgi:hypothetical protein